MLICVRKWALKFRWFATVWGLIELWDFRSRKRERLFCRSNLLGEFWPFHSAMVLEFNPLTMKSLATPIWVRLPNLPLHFWIPHFQSIIGNSMGHFFKINDDRISKGLATFARVCVEMDPSTGLPDRILINWTDDEPYIHLLDYENTSFRCTSCLQPRHL